MDGRVIRIYLVTLTDVEAHTMSINDKKLKFESTGSVHSIYSLYVADIPSNMTLTLLGDIAQGFTCRSLDIHTNGVEGARFHIGAASALQIFGINDVPSLDFMYRIMDDGSVLEIFFDKLKRLKDNV